jgi:hypothetical protein
MKLFWGVAAFLALAVPSVASAHEAIGDDELCSTLKHALQIFAKRIHRDAALCAVHKFPFAIEIETERQRACVGHVTRADSSDFRFRPIAIGGEAHEMFVE